MDQKIMVNCNSDKQIEAALEIERLSLAIKEKELEIKSTELDLMERTRKDNKLLRICEIIVKAAQVIAIPAVTIVAIVADHNGWFPSKLGLSVTPKDKLF